MILTTCAVCAVPLTHEAPATCAKCDTRYCSATCRHSHWRSGHRGLCPEIRRAGGAEQYNADKKYAEAVEVAVEECAEDTEGQTCYICLEDGSEEGLVRMCACRGAAGLAHVSCLAKQAKLATDELDTQNAWDKWSVCGVCKQDHHGVVLNALGWACWKTYVGRPEADENRQSALSTLGYCITSDTEAAISIHQAHLNSLRRFAPEDEEDILNAQAHLAIAYKSVGRPSEALALEREIYFKRKEMGECDENFIITVNNLASSLIHANLFGEAKALVREHLTAASDSLGVDHTDSLNLHLTYAESLLYECDDEEATDEQDREDYLEAERVAADVLRRVERILGNHHPVTIDARGILEEVRKDIASHERRTTLRALPKRARYS